MSIRAVHSGVIVEGTIRSMSKWDIVLACTRCSAHRLRSRTSRFYRCQGRRPLQGLGLPVFAQGRTDHIVVKLKALSRDEHYRN